MNCLCCGRPLSEAEVQSGWHQRCIRKFFGTETLPLIDLERKALEGYALKTAFKGLTVPGVQKKMSLHLQKEDVPRLTFVNVPTGYILKPQSEDYESLPEAEDLAMRLAERAGVRTVPHALLGTRGQFAYITKRIDRSISGKTVRKYAMEDFCQLDGRLTADKYKGSYERCAKIIDRYSARKGLDISELFLRLVISFITGNSDMHLKNFSLVETAPGNNEFVLSAAYDLLPVNIILPEDREEMALTLCGKKQHLRRKDFLEFAASCDMVEQAAVKILDRTLLLEPDYLAMCDDSYLPDIMRNNLKDLIAERCERLKESRK